MKTSQGSTLGASRELQLLQFKSPQRILHSLVLWIWAVIPGPGLSLGMFAEQTGKAEPGVQHLPPGLTTKSFVIPRWDPLFFSSEMVEARKTIWDKSVWEPLIPRHTGYELCCCVISCN